MAKVWVWCEERYEENGRWVRSNRFKLLYENVQAVGESLKVEGMLLAGEIEGRSISLI